MHALPEKLSALRHEIDAGVQRRLAEQVRRLEEQIQDTATRTQQCAFQQADEYFAPRLQELYKYVDAQIAPIVARVSDNSDSIASFVASVRKEIRTHVDDLNTRLVDVRAELPVLDARMKDALASIGQLEASQLGMSTAIQNVHDEMRSEVAGMQHNLAQDRHRADERQASLTLQFQDVKQVLEKGDASMEASFRQIRQALHRTSLLEERVHSRLEEFNDRFTQELADVRADHSGLATETPRLIGNQAEKVQGQIAAHRQHVEERLAPLEFQLRGEFKVLASEVTSVAETFAERACEHAAATSQEVDAQRIADRRALVGELHELRSRVDRETAHSLSAIRGLGESTAAAALQLEQRLNADLDQRFARAASSLRQENARDRKAQSDAEITLVKQLREDLHQSELKCQQHVESLSAHCEAAAVVGARSAVAGLGNQPQQRSLDALEANTSSKLNTDVVSGFASEQACLHLEVAQLRRMIHDESSELRAELRRDTCEIAVASPNARGDSSSRLSAVENALDRQRGQLERIDRNLRERCDSTSSELNTMSSQMQHKVVSLGTELTSVRAATTSLTQGVLKGLQVVGLLHDSAEVFPPRTADGVVPSECRQWGPGLRDLLDWEHAGVPLASRIEQQWRTAVQPGASELPRSLIALVQQKADGKDLLKLHSALRRRSLDTAGSPSWRTPAPYTELDRCSHSADGWANMDKFTGVQKLALPTPRGPLAPLSGRKGGAAPTP
mmetsp:Transcript_129404/g.335551  ORF Transcript_129404/g.335551 Transcript_129404/m.335551 type:complete len:734 (-) Transcript_129404:44-2245(-)